MSELPKGWESKQLKELFSFVLGGDWGKDPEYPDADFETVYCIRGTEFRNWKKEKGLTSVERKVKSSSVEKRKLQEGDILIEISGGGPDQPVGRTILIDEQALNVHENTPLVCTNFIRLARPQDSVSSRYLNYYLQSFYLSGEVTKYQGGSNNLRNLKFKEYEKIEVPIAPLEEQKRIADKLDSVLAKVEAAQARLDKIPDILKRFRQSVLAAATSGELTKDWREERQLAYDYEQYRFDEILVELRNGLSAKPNEDGKGTPILRISSVRAMEIDQADIRYLELADKEIEKYRLKVGDLLFTRYNGSLEFVGVCGVLENLKHDHLVYPDKLIRARLNEKAQPKYIEILFSSPEMRDNVTGCVKTTSGQKGISGKDLKKQSIMLPSICEQNELVKRVKILLDHADIVNKQYTAAKLRLDKLTQSILGKAFKGELINSSVDLENGVTDQVNKLEAV